MHEDDENIVSCFCCLFNGDDYGEVREEMYGYFGGYGDKSEREDADLVE
jgi:hypothetical protein